MNRDQLCQYITRCQMRFDQIDEEAPYEWNVIGSLTFQYFIGLSKSRRLFYRWIAEIKKSVSPQLCNWFAVIELDRWNNHICIHVLIGGSEVSLQPRWIVRWQELSGGDATVSEYRRAAFSKYVITETQNDCYFMVVMNLCGWGLHEIDRE